MAYTDEEVALEHAAAQGAIVRTGERRGYQLTKLSRAKHEKIDGECARCMRPAEPPYRRCAACRAYAAAWMRSARGPATRKRGRPEGTVGIKWGAHARRYHVR